MKSGVKRIARPRYGKILKLTDTTDLRGLKILYIGNFQSPYSTENDIAWTLSDMGATVYKKQENQDTTDEMIQWLGVADIILYTHTHGWITPGSFPMRKLLDKFRRRNTPTVGIHLDYWYGLERQKDVGIDDFWGVEYMFTPDGDKRSQQWFESLKINHHYLPPAVVKRDCYLAEPHKGYRSDVIFVGSKNYHKEWPYRTDLIEWLEKTYKNRFRHWGGDGIRSIRGDELNTLYASSKIAVGDSLCLDFNHQYYWSDRVYETRGRGGFLIHPAIVGLDSHLVTYRYKDFEQLKELIDFYIRNDEERERLRLVNHEYVKQNHTYHNRMQTMIEVLRRG